MVDARDVVSLMESCQKSAIPLFQPGENGGDILRDPLESAHRPKIPHSLEGVPGQPITAIMNLTSSSGTSGVISASAIFALCRAKEGKEDVQNPPPWPGAERGHCSILVPHTAGNDTWRLSAYVTEHRS